MFERAVVGVLNKYLAPYVKNDLDAADLSLSVWSGRVVLRNLELDPDGLAFLFDGQPIELVRGVVGRVDVQVPWKNLMGQALVAKVRDVHVIIRMKDEADADAAAAGAST